MKYKDMLIVPIIGLGWIENTITLEKNTFLVRHVIILFFSITFYKKL